MKNQFALAVSMALTTGVACAADPSESVPVVPESPHQVSVLQAFNDMDIDHDGILSEEELNKNPELSKQMTKMDKNKDDQVSKNEFKAFDRAGKGAYDLSQDAP